MPAELKLQKYNPYNDHIHVFLETYVFKKPQLNGSCKTKNKNIILLVTGREQYISHVFE